MRSWKVGDGMLLFLLLLLLLLMLLWRRTALQGGVLLPRRHSRLNGGWWLWCMKSTPGQVLRPISCRAEGVGGSRQLLAINKQSRATQG